MLEPKQVKYRTTGQFGLLDSDLVINAMLIAYDGDTDRGLLYHPFVKGECPSFEIARKGDDGIFEAIEASDQELYVNIGTKYRKFEKKFLGKNFKFKRVIYPNV